MDTDLLVWHVDSAYSRALKWLLLDLQKPHQDRLLQWHELRTDSVLAEINLKQQVPAMSLQGQRIFDTLFIALHLLGSDWRSSDDAFLFRLADSDLSESMRGFYRVHRYRKQPALKDTLLLHALKDEAWQHWNRCCVWIDKRLKVKGIPPVNIGSVLLHAIVASCLYFEPKIKEALPQSFLDLLTQVELHTAYRKMASAVNGQQRVPFYYITH